MLQFLLDEHLSPDIAEQLAWHRPDIPIFAMRDWEGRVHQGLKDAPLLTLAHERRLTLVTYDLHTIAPLLKTWGEQGLSHGGIVFVAEHPLAANNYGGLIRGLSQLWDGHGAEDWTDRVVFLARS